MSGARLTGKQKAFIDHYLANGFNGTRAAEAAGYKGSYSAWGVIAHENLRNPKIKAAIEQAMKDQAMGADEALARIGAMGRGDIRDLMGLSWTELQGHPQASLIKKVKRRTKTLLGNVHQEHFEIEMYDAQAAVNTVLKHHGLLKDGVTININIDLVVQAVQALEAAGLDPAAAFERLIQRAKEHAQQPG